MIGVLWAAVARAACPETATTADLDEAVAEARATIGSLDIEAFKAATDRLRGLVGCLGDPITRHAAAEVHRYLGIRAFGDRDPAAPTYFAAARSIQPEYVFPRSVIPEGNPVLAAYAAVDLTTRRTELAPEPQEGQVQFDGTTTRERPLGWPTIFQRFDAAGAVLESAYLPSEAPIPAYPTREVRIVALPDPERDGGAPAHRVGLLAGTATTAVASGVLYGLAAASRARFDDPRTPDGQLDQFERRTNSLVLASGITGAATLGLGVGLALTW